MCYAEEGRHPLPAPGDVAFYGTEKTFERRGGPPMPPMPGIPRGEARRAALEEV